MQGICWFPLRNWLTQAYATQGFATYGSLFWQNSLHNFFNSHKGRFWNVLIWRLFNFGFWTIISSDTRILFNTKQQKLLLAAFLASPPECGVATLSWPPSNLNERSWSAAFGGKATKTTVMQSANVWYAATSSRTRLYMEEWQHLHVAWTWLRASTTFISTVEAEEINACEANQKMGVVES